MERADAGTGTDREAVLQAIREAIEMHLAGMAEGGEPILEQKAVADYIEAAV